MVIINDYLLVWKEDSYKCIDIDTKEELDLDTNIIDMYNNIQVNFKDDNDLYILGIMTTFINNNDINTSIDLTIINSDELLLSVNSLKFYANVINRLKFNSVEIVVDDNKKLKWENAIACVFNNCTISSINVYGKINKGYINIDDVRYTGESFICIYHENESEKVIDYLDILMIDNLNNDNIHELYNALDTNVLTKDYIVKSIRLFSNGIDKFSFDKQSEKCYNDICDMVDVVYTSNSLATKDTIFNKNKKELYYNI